MYHGCHFVVRRARRKPKEKIVLGPRHRERIVCHRDKFTASNPRSHGKYFYRLGRSRARRAGRGMRAKIKRKREKCGTMAPRGCIGGGNAVCTPKDRNASSERYFAPPNGRICKLVSGVSLYGETPRLEGRRRREGGRG